MNIQEELKDRKTYDYSGYRAMIDELAMEGKTTGENHSEAMLGHTTMNIARMNRLDKKAAILPELADVVNSLPPQKWLVISEAWCGDAAQNLPWINRLAELNDGIELTILLRDENLDIMDQFLTNGGRSIPKLIGMDANKGDVLFDWGPRPLLMQGTYSEMKAEGLEYGEISKTIHTMYAKDKGNAFQTELIKLLTPFVV